MHILVVEDETALLNTTAAALGLAGHTTARAETGYEALERIDAQIPDLVLLDLQMPVMDGYEFLRLFRARPSCAYIPVVVMSAGHRVPTQTLDVQAFFDKPFDLDDLLDTIEQLLAARASTQDRM